MEYEYELTVLHSVLAVVRFILCTTSEYITSKSHIKTPPTLTQI